VNTVDDLRRAFDRHLPATHDTAGIVAGAYAGAARVRRNRRIAATVAAAVAALLVAVGIPLAAHRNTTPAEPEPARSTADMTVDLAGEAQFTVVQRAADGARQLLVADPAGGPPEGSVIKAGEVWAYDPGAFDPKALPPGRTVRVHGHDALLVPALSEERYEFLRDVGAFATPPAADPAPGASGTFSSTSALEAAVVWRDPSGIWITVSKTARRDILLALAEAVRVTEPRPPAGPVGLSWLPPGLAVTHAETMERFPGMYGQIELTVPEPGTNVVAPPSQGPGATTVTIRAVQRSRTNDWADGIKLPAPTLTVAGHPGWYFHGEMAGFSFARSEGRLLIDTGSCGIRVDVADDSLVTSFELLKMMSLATYGSCTDRTGWAPAVG
jgi:hypothetical protein